MAKVIVKFFASVREAAGVKSREMEARNIRHLLDILVQEFGPPFRDTVIDPDTGELKRFFSCMVNGRRIELLNGYGTELRDGDVVAIFPPVGGG